MMPELPHWLIVKEWDADEDELLDVEHHPDCPTEIREEEPNTYTVYTCVVEEMIADSGLESYFQHRDDPAPNEHYAERVAPGRWPIEPWSETYHGFEGDEYDAGLRLTNIDNLQRDGAGNFIPEGSLRNSGLE